ncbi:hypothetical protein EMN47_06350 [Prolixibacteraceae bacterium JC049]|nr:hypothetical protein [Prolixibacteraceae bacterium JC049]
MKRIFNYIAIVSVVCFLVACSTDKNTRINRAYHNVTARYNVYFNGNEALKAGVVKIENAYPDDFSQLLSIYKESDPRTAKTAVSDMDIAILKASKLIKLHSITKKPKRRKRRTESYRKMAAKKEYNKWVDNAYLMMGKAYFYQQNYLQAINNFSHVIRNYETAEDHITRYSCFLWLVRSYIESERFGEARDMLQRLQTDADFPKKLDGELSLITADYNIKQGDLNEAVPYMEIAVKKIKKRTRRMRYRYILAQLYQQTDHNEKATALYRSVIKMNPSYEMAFNARISIAEVYSGANNSEYLQKELRKMLRDSKNTEYLDQIYFAQGRLFQRLGETDKAVVSYRKSSAHSTTNNSQKIITCNTLGELFYKEQNYIMASAYYDSAFVLMDGSYPDYERLSKLNKSLKRLANNLYEVERQDSLQQLANMDKADRDELVAGWIQKEVEAEQERKKLEQDAQNNQSFYRSNQYRFTQGNSQRNSTNPNQRNTSNFYFYNPTTVAYGISEFQRLWGKRKLEDNWRRKHKGEVTFDEEGNVILAEDVESDTLNVADANRITDKMKPDYYLQDVPLTDSAMVLSHNSIKESLFNAGRIFRTDFSDNANAIKQLEELNRRYPSNDYELLSFFDLYGLFNDEKDGQSADKYKNEIIRLYPQTKYAKFLQDPDYFANQQLMKDSVNRLYNRAFNMFKRKEYGALEQLCMRIETLKPDSLLKPKLAFLNTVAKGKQQSAVEFSSALQTYVNTYPKAEPKPLADQMIKLLADSTLNDYQKLVAIGYINEELQNEEVINARNIDDEFDGKFSYDEELLHHFVIAYPKKAKIDVNRLKFDIANYNIDHYASLDFDIETQPLNENTSILVVKSMDNKQKALIYFRSIIRKREVFQSLKGVDYVNFVASSANFREVASDRNYFEYLKFFVKNYSRFISSDFPEELPEQEATAEELMARVDKEDEAPEEKGEFVMVTPERDNKAPKQDKFVPSFNRSHAFVITVFDKNFKFDGTINEFKRFVKAQFPDENITYETIELPTAQALLIKGLDDGERAMSFFRNAVSFRQLFKFIGMKRYRNFIISKNNLEVLKRSADIDKYMAFFRETYIRRKTAKPASNRVAKPITKQPEKKKEPVKKQNNKPAVKQLTGDYTFVPSIAHMFALVIPTDGVDHRALTTAFDGYNKQNGVKNAKISTEQLDFRTVLKIEGFKSAEEAKAYMKKIVQQRQLFRALTGKQYRNFVISDSNYLLFKQKRNITKYMDFYKQNYLK